MGGGAAAGGFAAGGGALPLLSEEGVIMALQQLWHKILHGGAWVHWSAVHRSCGQVRASLAGAWRLALAVASS